MITPNVAARDYRWHLDFSAVKNSEADGHAPQGQRVIQLTWGNDYLVHVHGWTLSIGTLGSYTSHSATYGITFESPFASDYSDFGTTFLTAKYARVEMDGVTLTTDCYNWELSFDELRVLTSDDGSSYTTVVTIAGTVDSGGAWDPRLNCLLNGGGSHIEFEVLPFDPNCASIPGLAEYDRETSCGGNCGWVFKAAGASGGYTGYDLISLDTVATPATACGSCAPTEIVAITVDSRSVSVSTTAVRILVISDPYDVFIACIDPPGNVQHFKREDWTLEAKEQQFFIRLASKAAPMRHHHWHVTALCNTTTSTDDEDVSDAYCVCGVTQDQNIRQYDTGFCLQAQNPLVCIDFPPFDGRSTCLLTISKIFSWDVEPPCPPDEGVPLAYDVSFALRHGRVSARTGSAHLWSGFSQNSSPSVWQDSETTITADVARIRFADHTNQWLGVLYSSSAASSLYYAVTPDEGASFSMATTIATNLATGGFFDFEESQDFQKWFFWLVGASAPYTVWVAIYDTQLNLRLGPIATNITNADLAPIAVREYPIAGGGRAIGMLYSVAGSPTYVSTRNGTTFV